MAAPRVAERGHEDKRSHHCAGDLDQTLAEVDLHLPARRRLKPHASQRLRFQCLPEGLNGALQRPPADGHALFRKQILAHHVGVAAMPVEALAQPVL